MKLIDKDALVAEIERRKDEYLKHCRNKSCAEWSCGTLDNILSFIDTLEVKWVDLDYIKKELDELIRLNKPNGDFGWGTLYNVATHFFELGLKAKGK